MEYNVVKKLGVGSAGDAYLLDDGRAIIVGKREDSFSTYKVLFEKMEKLKGKVSAVNYPKIYELISPCEDYPFGAVVEEYISGVELRKINSELTDAQKRTIGKILANFVEEIHNIKANGNKYEEVDINLSKLDRSLGILQEYISPEMHDKLIEIKPLYKQFIESKEFCYTHGDLNSGNIMINQDGTLSGVIDFGNMEYYIPEIEFVHMYFFDRVIYDSMVENYPKKIEEKDIVLLELIVNIRHFKNIRNFEERRQNCLNNIGNLLNKYLSMDISISLKEEV
ncbi:MAG: aminoglycoside phosphotransferase family protein [Clostridia bacterium]|nr:aminoglycoside phosphotransferase family protein [Clostridia bacterium]